MRVVNIRKEKYTHYIGRPSVLCNPFPMDKDHTREDVVRLFEEYARTNSTVLKAIRELPENAVLGCFCNPKMCHGDIIIRIKQEMNNEPTS